MTTRRVPLGARWALWPVAGLRSAGFPLSMLEGTEAKALFAELDTATDDVREHLVEAEEVRLARLFGERLEHLREAIAWQNRGLFEGTLRSGVPLDKGRRPRLRASRLVGRYLQRYCAKNETIGFFGPIAFASVGEAAETIAEVTGGPLVSRRKTYVEAWVVDDLVRALLARDGGLDVAVPSSSPIVELSPRGVRMPGTDPMPLPANIQCLLEACDGRRTMAAIAADLAPSEHFPSSGDVRAAARSAIGLGWLVTDLEVPLCLEPLEHLERRLATADQNADVTWAVEACAALRRARDEVGEAAGDGAAVARAYGAFDALFTSLTGSAHTRAAGQSYAQRTTLYEDCVRSGSYTFGRRDAEALGPALSPILDSAAWFTRRVAAAYRAELRRLHAELAARSGSGAVSMLDFQAAFFANPSLGGGRGAMPTPVTSSLDELARRWEDIADRLAVSQERAGGRKIATGDALDQAVADAFGHGEVGWWSAREAAPDLFVTRDPEAPYVLGELHFYNTLLTSALAAQYPHPEELLTWLADDVPEQVVVPVPPKSWIGQRSNFGVVAPHHERYVFGLGSGMRRDACLTAPELVVVADEASLQVQHRATGRAWDVIEFFGFLLSVFCSSGFGVVRPAAYSERLTIGGVVVSRRRWRVPASEIPLDPRRAPEVFRQWAAREGLPRHVFYKTTGERKPMYLDLDSWIYLDLFLQSARASAERGPDSSVTFTEMLPAPDAHWLVGGDGKRYSSEFRLVTSPRGPGAA